MCIPNVRSWAIGVSEPLDRAIDIASLPALVVSPKVTPPRVTVKPVVGGRPEEVMTLDEFRAEWPPLRISFLLAKELLDRTSPEDDDGLRTGATFNELLSLTTRYLETRVKVETGSDVRDVGIYFWRKKIMDALETAIRGTGGVGPTQAVPILGDPDYLDTSKIRPFPWYGPVAKDVRKTCTNVAACSSSLEVDFCRFMESCRDVERYVKNERLRFSIAYYENGRARQYFPDFVVRLRSRDDSHTHWVVETKGERFPNTYLKREAAQLWCKRLSGRRHGPWRYLFVQQLPFGRALNHGVSSFGELADALVNPPWVVPEPTLFGDKASLPPGAYEKLLPLYSLEAAAGTFGSGTHVEPQGWIKVTDAGTLDKSMFVAKAKGKSMEPTIYDGDYCVFRRSPRVAQGTVVLAQWNGPEDPDTGGAYAVKIFSSRKVVGADGQEELKEVVLSPLNPSFKPLVVSEEDGHQLSVVGSFVSVIRPE